MSTFKGIVAEFPQIRIDYFRTIQDQSPPLACFLSHVHSDHLQGLESLKSPFVYCSAATRELLLRLEKYPHRMNFAKGVLESRTLHYRHLKTLLKPIPLNTPTAIELSPGFELRVTLFDANHCAGAVMFLIQGQGKAVLYTGDIRSEPWWVNALVRDPVLVPYTLGKLRLDKIYLDTTFAVNSDPYRSFPSKAEGLRELLDKVTRYPDNTTFHFNAWTLGYEDVWIALSSALQSPVHVDRYKMGLYRSITTLSGKSISCHEGPPLCGFNFGNRFQPGCLTSDQGTRLHSCEGGTICSVHEATNVVNITPIISRLSNGAELPEIGAGGGGGDLNETHELELDDAGAVGMLLKLCTDKVQDPTSVTKICSLITRALVSGQKLSLDGLAQANNGDSIPISDFVELLTTLAKSKEGNGTAEMVRQVPKLSGKRKLSSPASDGLPRTITFPYSRHSSYEELCHLVEAFKPEDLYPCTTDEESWHSGVSMRALFGHLCSGSTFSHDREMEMAISERAQACSRKRQRDADELDDNLTASSQSSCGSDESDRYQTNEANDQVTHAATTPIEIGIEETRTLAYSPSEHIAKKSKYHHQQGAATGNHHSQQDRIDAVAKSFVEQAHNGRSRQRQPDNVQSKSTGSSSQGFSHSRSSLTGSQTTKPHKVPTSSPITTPSKRQSPRKRVSASSRSAKTSRITPKNHRCGWLGCNERFSSLGSAGGLEQHVYKSHCVSVGTGQSALYACLWGSCRKENIYFSSEELWKKHMHQKHLIITRALPKRSNTDKVQGPSSLPTPPAEPHTRSTNTHIDEPPRQLTSFDAPSSVNDKQEEDGTADNSDPSSSFPESLLFDSQSTIFADDNARERLLDRQEAFIATLSAHDAIHLISTGDGHTEQEMEL